LILSVNNATCTEVDPVSLGCSLNFSINVFFFSLFTIVANILPSESFSVKLKFINNTTETFEVNLRPQVPVL